MSVVTTIPGFSGELVPPGHHAYDQHREIWNAVVDRRPALIARCASSADVAAAIRHGREHGLEIAVKCGGHGVLGLAVPEGGLMIDLTPMGEVRVDPSRRRAVVGGGALLRALDRATEPHGLATTAGNVSHTGVGGLTLGGGMGWLARRCGLACDNVEAYTVVTATGQTVRATATEHPDLFWGLRGGGGNFGVVTEFEFRLHPTTGQALVAGFTFDPADAVAPLRAWRDSLADAPREVTLTADAYTAAGDPATAGSLAGRPIVEIGFAWIGQMSAARAYLDQFRRRLGVPRAESVEEVRYVELQSAGDERHGHGLRRYSTGHYLRELPDAAIDAFLSRGIPASAPEPDWTRQPGAGFQAHGGAIADIDDDASAFSFRDSIVEWFGGATWADRDEDATRISATRAWGRALDPFATGVYVNVIADEGTAGVRRAYRSDKFERLVALKRAWDPDNVFHLNQNISPGSA
ncbi:MAG TPA: FAD-binding oxidoreductase [Candidatus Limnocylindrales bacterium]|nr:FAD-binding oxidoreductase [Candidatus Limnocylindrales bacterium]